MKCSNNMVIKADLQTERRIPSPVANVGPCNAAFGKDYHEAIFMAGFKTYAVSSSVFSSSEPDREII